MNVPSQLQTERRFALRQNFRGKILVRDNRGVFALTSTFSGINISRRGVLGSVDATYQKFVEVQLAQPKLFLLQLENSLDEAFPPLLLRARCVRTEQFGNRMVAAFAFMEEHPDLIGYLPQ